MAGPLMRLAQLQDDLGARGRHVPHPASLDALAPAVEQLAREPVRVRGERLVQRDAHQLQCPVVLSLPALFSARRPARALRRQRRAHARKWQQVAEPVRFEARGA
jgi:hypothetical protein